MLDKTLTKLLLPSHLEMLSPKNDKGNKQKSN
jgi:hypothetical protein